MPRRAQFRETKLKKLEQQIENIYIRIGNAQKVLGVKKSLVVVHTGPAAKKSSLRSKSSTSRRHKITGNCGSTGIAWTAACPAFGQNA